MGHGRVLSGGNQACERVLGTIACSRTEEMFQFKFRGGCGWKASPHQECGDFHHRVAPQWCGARSNCLNLYTRFLRHISVHSVHGSPHNHLKRRIYQASGCLNSALCVQALLQFLIISISIHIFPAGFLPHSVNE